MELELKKGTILTACAYCSQPVAKWPFQLKAHPRHFCGNVCKGKWMTLHLIADKSANWKGGEYSTIANILCNSRYRRIRALAIAIDGGCKLCGSVQRLEVHHIIEKGKNAALIYDITNMITLCKPCHWGIRGNEEDYVGLFDGIVAKRPNSVEPKALAEKQKPWQYRAKQEEILGVCREHGASSKEMICSDTPTKDGDTIV